MKTLALAIFALTFAPLAFAPSASADDSADFHGIDSHGQFLSIVKKLHLNSQHPGSEVANRGSLLVNMDARTVRLDLVGGSSCPPHAMCIMSFLPTFRTTIDLPIVSVEKDRCGNLTVTALEDGRPWDADLRKLTIRDNSHNICRMLIAPMTATYETVTSGAFSPIVEATSTLEGSAFVPQMELLNP